jgi:hypothetical protein
MTSCLESNSWITWNLQTWRGFWPCTNPRLFGATWLNGLGSSWVYIIYINVV